MVVALGVDFVDHGRQRRGLAGPGGAGHQDQSTRLVAKFCDHGGQAQLVKILDFKRNHTEHGRGRAALIENVGTKTSEALQTERKVQFKAFLEAMLLRVGHDRVGKLLGLRRRHLRQVERDQVPVHANLGRRIGGDVEIAAAHLQHPFQQIT